MPMQQTGGLGVGRFKKKRGGGMWGRVVGGLGSTLEGKGEKRACQQKGLSN